MGIDVTKYTNLTPQSNDQIQPEIVVTTTTTTTKSTMTRKDEQNTKTGQLLPTHYQSATSTGLNVRHARPNPGYETVTNFKRKTTDDIQAIKKVEVIRTYSLGTSAGERQKQQQNLSNDDQEKHYAVPGPINHYQTPTNNSLVTTDCNIEPYQVSNVNGAFLKDSDLDLTRDANKPEEKLDILLGDLDHGYGLIKEKRLISMLREIEKASHDKQGDDDDNESKRVSLHETISVGIYAEREGKMYYPGHVVEIA